MERKQNYGTKLKLRRQYLGMTQSDLAHKVCMDKNIVTYWENSKYKLQQIKTAIALAKALDETVENLFA